MKELWGNTYPFREEIKSDGGKWCPLKKVWSVPESVYGEWEQKIKASTRKKSGQLWEDCPRCGNQPVYMSLNHMCERCA